MFYTKNNDSKCVFKNQVENEKIKEQIFNDPGLREVVLKKSTYLANRFKGIKSANDIEDELYVELFKSSKRFDSKKGSFHTFFGKIIRNYVATYFRNNDPKKVAKRPKFQSLTPLIESDDVRLADSKNDPGDVVEKEELNQKIRSVIANMPDELRRICFVLEKMPSFAAAARELGISQKALEIKRTTIEKSFLDAGYDHKFKDFFKKGGE